jgi:hypothetical protein
MITTTLAHLVDAYPALSRLAQLRLPVKVAYRVAKLLKAIGSEIKTFEEQRNALVIAHGAARPATEAEIAATGQTTIHEVDADKRAAFFAAVRELGGLEVQLAGEAITLEELAGDMTAADLVALGPLVAE